IDVPKTFSQARVESYETFAWPAFAAPAFRRPWIATLVALAASAIVTFALARAGSTFYDVISHDRMVTLFGAVGLFAFVALLVSYQRFNRAVEIPILGPTAPAVRDALTLKHLHATGEDCVDAEERRTPWRRWMHHCTFYGFALCFASTTVAAIYHLAGWIA